MRGPKIRSMLPGYTGVCACGATIATALLIALAAVPASAEPYLVADINTRHGGSNPTTFVGTGERVFFVARRADVGNEVWTSDGTAEGTRLLFDASPGTPSGLSSISNFRRLTVAEEMLFIGTTDDRLWSMPVDEFDGGPHPLDVPGLSEVHEFLGAFGTRLVFAGQGDGGVEPWISDGTVGGTYRLADVTPGEGSSGLAGLAVFEGKAYFLAENRPAGQLWRWQLWTTDGTVAGTSKVATIELGESVAGCRSQRIAATAHGVVFPAWDDESGCELWGSNGSALGTRQLIEADGDFEFSTPEDFVTVGGRVFYSRFNDLWVTDGRSGGTNPLGVELDSGAAAALGTDRLLFRSRGELSVSDGTPGGTRTLDIDFYPNHFTSLGDRVYFRGEATVGDGELWVSDGTTSGTRLAVDLLPGDRGSHPIPTAAAGRLWLAAWTPEQGREPWVSDGTPAGTVSLGDLDSETTSGSFPRFLKPFGRRVLFDLPTELNPARNHLWLSDGTEAGTGPLQDPPGLQLDAHGGLTQVGDRLYFFNFAPEVGHELFSLDRDGEEPTPYDFVPGPGSSAPISMADVDGTLYFSSERGQDIELWRFDGEVATVIATLFSTAPDPSPGAGPGASPSVAGPAQKNFFDFRRVQIVPWGQRMAIFVTEVARDVDPSATGTEEWLWISDGTAAGTARVAPVRHLLAERFSGVSTDTAALGDRLYFFSRSSVSGLTELWSTDGTVDGTSRVLSLGGSLRETKGLLAHGDHLYFLVGRPGEDQTLWRSDGTAGGTAPLYGDVFEMHSAGGSLLLAAELDDSGGRELWRVVDEPPRLEAVADLNPGPDDSNPRLFASRAGITYFAAFEPTSTLEVWRTDGTPEGTTAIGDVGAGGLGGAFWEIVAAEDRIYLSADDRVHGGELWAAPVACVRSSETLCLNGGRFQVRARWRDVAGSGERGMARTRPLTEESGAFYFFDAENLELAVKVLDGRALTGHYWVFYASLTDVEFDLEVFDTATGQMAVYRNPAGSQASRGDTEALPEEGSIAGLTGGGPAIPFKSVVPGVTIPAAGLDPASGQTGSSGTGSGESSGACQPTDEALCLGDGRFRLTARWKDFEGRTGQGMVEPLTGDTGAFWFFGADNLELLVKVLDGRGFNGHFWIFYASLTNVELTLTVEDLETGQRRTYRNPLGQFASLADTTAF
ncbi:MAG: hypothetical protein AAGM22_19470 [Acidobacteriota bacterium]